MNRTLLITLIVIAIIIGVLIFVAIMTKIIAGDMGITPMKLVESIGNLK